MTLNIAKATVLQGVGPDIVYIHTDLPHPFVAEVSTQPLTLKFEVLSESGVEYVRNNFGIEPEVLNHIHARG